MRENVELHLGNEKYLQVQDWQRILWLGGFSSWWSCTENGNNDQSILKPIYESRDPPPKLNLRVIPVVEELYVAVIISVRSVEAFVELEKYFICSNLEGRGEMIQNMIQQRIK